MGLTNCASVSPGEITAGEPTDVTVTVDLEGVSEGPRDFEDRISLTYNIGPETFTASHSVFVQTEQQFSDTFTVTIDDPGTFDVEVSDDVGNTLSCGSLTVEGAGGTGGTGGGDTDFGSGTEVVDLVSVNCGSVSPDTITVGERPNVTVDITVSNDAADRVTATLQVSIPETGDQDRFDLDVEAGSQQTITRELFASTFGNTGDFVVRTELVDAELNPRFGGGFGFSPRGVINGTRRLYSNPRP